MKIKKGRPSGNIFGETQILFEDGGKKVKIDKRKKPEENFREVLRKTTPKYYDNSMTLFSSYFHVCRAEFVQQLSKDMVVSTEIYIDSKWNKRMEDWDKETHIKSISMDSRLKPVSSIGKDKGKIYSFSYKRVPNKIVFDDRYCFWGILDSILKEKKLTGVKIPEIKRTFHYNNPFIQMIMFNPTQERLKEAVKAYKEAVIWVEKNQDLINNATGLISSAKALEEKLKGIHYTKKDIKKPIEIAIESLYSEAEKQIAPLRKAGNQMPKDILRYSF